MNQRDEAIYAAARHVGIPSEKVTNFLGTLKICGYVLAETHKHGIAFPVRTSEPEEGEDVAILDANGQELGADEIVRVLNSSSSYVGDQDQAIKDAAADISSMMPSGMQHGTGAYEKWVEGAIRRSFERHGISSRQGGTDGT